MHRLFLLPLSAVLISAGGCATVGSSPFQAAGNAVWCDNGSKTWQAERVDRGLVIVLPGSWGDSPADHGIVKGLIRSNLDAKIEIDDWTVGHWTVRPLLIPYNVRALERNQAQARRIADKIVAYQTSYPGRPVYLVGYSGGGAVAVMALESLPENLKITGAVLLAPSLSCTYDLQRALRHTEQGIRNFYSPLDIPVLAILCTAIGTSDGRHVLPAGVVGFFGGETPDEPSVAAASRLEQQAYQPSMLLRGHAGGHFGWIGSAFVADRVAPLVKSENAPSSPLEQDRPATATTTRRPTEAETASLR